MVTSPIGAPKMSKLTIPTVFMDVQMLLNSDKMDDFNSSEEIPSSYSSHLSGRSSRLKHKKFKMLIQTFWHIL